MLCGGGAVGSSLLLYWSALLELVRRFHHDGRATFIGPTHSLTSQGFIQDFALGGEQDGSRMIGACESMLTHA